MHEEHQDINTYKLRLLVSVSDGSVSGSSSIELCGRRWVFVDFDNPLEAPSYICISYSWGRGRTRNIFEDEELISDRTIPALKTVIETSESPELWAQALSSSFNEKTLNEELAAALKASQAIWIDALCVPRQGPVRNLCLLSMGEIYRSATLVIGVLSPIYSQVLRKIKKKEILDFVDLKTVEDDDWAARAWTYQEIANSRLMLFVSQGDAGSLIDRYALLSALVTATGDYCNANGIEHVQLSEKFPRIDRIEELLAEQQILESSGRCAYQVISSMHARFSEREEDRIAAMISVISSHQSFRQNIQLATSADHFREICEDSGDYSFIFTTEARSQATGEKWRPTGDKMTPVVSGLLAFGNGLAGSKTDNYLRMDNMCRMEFGNINSVASAFGAFLGRKFPVEILERLRYKSFTGCGQYLSLEYGYFFPQSPLKQTKGAFIAISNDVSFAQGAPALLLKSNGTEVYEFLDTGVFIGRCPKKSESIHVS